MPRHPDRTSAGNSPGEFRGFSACKSTAVEHLLDQAAILVTGSVTPVDPVGSRLRGHLIHPIHSGQLALKSLRLDSISPSAASVKPVRLPGAAIRMQDHSGTDSGLSRLLTLLADFLRFYSMRKTEVFCGKWVNLILP